MLIRNEEPRDHDAIHQLTTRAFEPMPFSDGTEAPIIRMLRESGDMTISLVAEENRKIVGHITFSPVTVGSKYDGWFGLGPGLALLKERGAHGCALIGSPDLYSRFGFRSDGRLTYGSVDPSYVQWIVFDGQPPIGELKFAPAFYLAG